MYTANVDTKGQEVFVTIPKGATYEQAMDSIESKKVIIDKLAFRFMAKLMDYPELVKPGRYELINGSTNYQLLRKLRSGDQDPLKLTFNNIRLKQNLVDRLAAQVSADREELDSLINNPEYVKSLGFDTTTIVTMFIPNTYEVYWTISADELMKRMKKEYDAFWNEKRMAKAESLKLTPVQVSTLASIVQAETVKNDEKP
ncbi:MAG: endolytic transglycosylase MltG, partial [Hymenobacteraceae bacterium]|nr:endolytic transglycosylase MltG [Hymenobacteraceae bacterium]MDX5397460.1 endolytic transglycosylase MltG [Hymenobacteraceae bacterium]MDX5513538.1 endolytic transglycosylase MltG [Hymenobacteraceae bacterium]